MILVTGSELFHSGRKRLDVGYLTFFSEYDTYSLSRPPFPLNLIAKSYCRKGCDYLQSRRPVHKFVTLRNLRLIAVPSETCLNLLSSRGMIEFLISCNADGFVTSTTYAPRGGRVYLILMSDDIQYTQTRRFAKSEYKMSSYVHFISPILHIPGDIILAIVLYIVSVSIRRQNAIVREREFRLASIPHVWVRPIGPRIMSWNVHFFRSHTLKDTLASIMDAIFRCSPDVLCLQEVYTAPMCPSLSQLKRLLHNIGHVYVEHDAKSGLLCSTRFPTTFECHKLSKTRSYILATLWGMRIVNVHLEVQSEEERMIQIRKLLDVVSTDKRVLLIGDFNTLNREDYSREQWRNMEYRERGYMFDPTVVSHIKTNDFKDIFSFAPAMTSIFNRRVDYAFAKNVAIHDAFVNKQDRCSDHLALIVDLPERYMKRSI